MGPTWGPPGSCRPQIGPMLVPWTLLSGKFRLYIWDKLLKGKLTANTDHLNRDKKLLFMVADTLLYFLCYVLNTETLWKQLSLILPWTVFSHLLASWLHHSWLWHHVNTFYGTGISTSYSVVVLAFTYWCKWLIFTSELQPWISTSHQLVFKT